MVARSPAGTNPLGSPDRSDTPATSGAATVRSSGDSLSAYRVGDRADQGLDPVNQLASPVEVADRQIQVPSRVLSTFGRLDLMGYCRRDSGMGCLRGAGAPRLPA